MTQHLPQLVADVASLHSKLILLIGRPRSGKSKALRELATAVDANVLNVGAALGRGWHRCRRSSDRSR